MRHIASPHSTSSLTDIDKECVQPNAVDLRIDKVFRINETAFILSEDFKAHRGSVEIQPNVDGWFTLAPGHYEVIMKNNITVGSNEAGWVITRSTLNRNGVFLTSGLYDTGYSGVMAAAMHVTVGVAEIQKGTRIGQYLSFAAEALHNYEGSYGAASEHDKKYTT